MKKTLCLLAVLAIAASASAAVDVIVAGDILSPWISATTGSPYGAQPFEELQTAADGKTTAAKCIGTAWTEVRCSTTGVAVGNNTTLEYDVYYRSKGGAGNFTEAMHIEVNGDGGWNYKWQGAPSEIEIDGRTYVGLDSQGAVGAMTRDTWHHISIDLTKNCYPMQGQNVLPLPTNPTLGAIRMYIGVQDNWAEYYISNMAFVPEPATLVLLAAGALIINRKRKCQ